MIDRQTVIAIAVAMGTPKSEAEANFDAAYPAANEPGAGDVVGVGREARPDGTKWEIVIYGDGRREETLIGE